jgi:hypothetical protein
LVLAYNSALVVPLNFALPRFISREEEGAFMASASVVLLALLVALCCCGWAQSSEGSGPDKEFQEFVAKHNIKLSNHPLSHNCLELWGELFDENVQTGKWYDVPPFLLLARSLACLSLPAPPSPSCTTSSAGRWRRPCRLVFFSAQWSSDSRRMPSIWAEFTQQGQRQYPWLKFAHVRCDHEKSLCNDRLSTASPPPSTASADLADCLSHHCRHHRLDQC